MTDSKRSNQGCACGSGFDHPHPCKCDSHAAHDEQVGRTTPEFYPGTPENAAWLAEDTQEYLPERPAHIILSRKNVEALLHMLDNRDKARPAIVKGDGLTVEAQENDEHYKGRTPGAMSWERHGYTVDLEQTIRYAVEAERARIVAIIERTSRNWPKVTNRPWVVRALREVVRAIMGSEGDPSA